VDEGRLGMIGLAGGFQGVVVSRHDENAALTGGTRTMRMAKDVAAAVEPGALPVPEAEYAIDRGLWVQRHLLRPPHRGQGKVFVDPRLEPDVLGLQMPVRAPRLGVDARQRRAAITGDEA